MKKYIRASNLQYNSDGSTNYSYNNPNAKLIYDDGKHHIWCISDDYYIVEYAMMHDWDGIVEKEWNSWYVKDGELRQGPIASYGYDFTKHYSGSARKEAFALAGVRDNGNTEDVRYTPNTVSSELTKSKSNDSSEDTIDLYVDFTATKSFDAIGWDMGKSKSDVNFIESMVQKIFANYGYPDAYVSYAYSSSDPKGNNPGKKYVVLTFSYKGILADDESEEKKIMEKIQEDVRKEFKQLGYNVTWIAYEHHNW